ncbi:MAG: TraM recognition domain-containing protein, partial [Actinomycetota bacterium]|nr:TraM recognition domain-containing protein [Actinomycetota bacterium]
LRAAAGVTGAQGAARGLVELASTRGMDNGDFWMDTAEGLLWPLFLVAAGAGASMADVVRWVTTHDRPSFDHEGRLVAEGEVAGALRRLEQAGGRLRAPGARAVELGDLRLAGEALGGLWSSDERTRSGVYTTARTVIKAWSDPAVAAAAAACEITPEWLLGGDNTLYIVAPAKEQARLRAVFASLVADLVGAAFDTATRNGGTLERRLLVLLDEAANICPVRELPAWCSTCPSHGITLVTAWQDRSQQRLRYGPDAAETIWNNSGAKIILSGLADHATAEVTSLLGEEDHQRHTASVDLGSGGRQLTTATATRALVTTDALRRQGRNHGLLIYRDLPPAHLVLRPWHAEGHLRRLHRARPSWAERARPLAARVEDLLVRLAQSLPAPTADSAGPSEPDPDHHRGANSWTTKSSG